MKKNLIWMLAVIQRRALHPVNSSRFPPIPLMESTRLLSEQVRIHPIDDLCYKLFIEEGFEWGGDWTTCKDYQHFELKD